MRLAIYGGTFNPIHNAHLRIARAAADRFALDRVLFVPAAHPPHKNGREIVPYEHRLRMVRLACESDPRFEPSDIESGSEKSYSIRTIQRLCANLGPDDRLFFLIGADAFGEIETWYRWRDVVRLVEFLVVTRPGHQYEVPAGAIVLPVDGLEVPVSSSDIRAKLRAGLKPPELPDGVYDYIRQHGLYHD